jgi:hypothetical protein|tara:strand:+ start:2386 stop:2784 length:399 start_codon:yes stop_codon:yes gene_type:complete
MSKVDKIVLIILAIEHLGFGLYGLYAPSSIAELVGYELSSDFAFSEIRANYMMFTALGLIALFSIFFRSLMRQTYIIYIFIFSSLILGRVLNYFITGDLPNSIIVTTVAEIIVVFLSIWRLNAKTPITENIE